MSNLQIENLKIERETLISALNDLLKACSNISKFIESDGKLIEHLKSKGE